MTERISNLEGLILRRVAEVGQKTVCEALNKDPSTVSRIFSGKLGIQLGELETLLGCLGLIVIERDGSEIKLSKEDYQALLTIARKGLNSMSEDSNNNS